MKNAVISYSLTGNNQALAGSVAAKLAADHLTVESKRTTGAIALDMLFGRVPQVKPEPSALEKYDLVLFFGPVWMGQSASPLRAYFRSLTAHPHKYAFVSISGGADGPNPKLAEELTKRTGYAPQQVVDLHIADLLPRDPKPTRKDTSAYHLTAGDIANLTDQVISHLKPILGAREG